ncbi:MAG: hypothetical protein ABEJ26_01915 [Halosimplex sp.]
MVYDTFFARGAEFALRRAGGYTLADVERELLERGYSQLVPLVDVVDESGLHVPFPVAVALLLALPFVAEFLHVVGVRALAAPDLDSVPVDRIRSGLAGASLRSVLASFVAVVLVLIGSVFFLVPGLALAVLFLFVRQRIAPAGDGVFEALSESYALVRENALSMVALVVFWLTWVVATFVAGTLPLGDLSGPVVRTVGTAVVVFGISLFTSAYLQAVGGDGGAASATPAGQSDRLGARSKPFSPGQFLSEVWTAAAAAT